MIDLEKLLHLQRAVFWAAMHNSPFCRELVAIPAAAQGANRQPDAPDDRSLSGHFGQYWRAI